MVPLWLSPSDPPSGDTGVAAGTTAIEGVTFAELPMTAHVVIVHHSLADGYAVYRLELPEFAEPNPNGPRLGWTNQSAAAGDDLATGVAVTADGTAYVTGTVRGLLSEDRAPGVTQSQIAAYDASGQLVWSRPINGPSWVRAADIAISSTNLVVVAGDVAENLPGQVSAGGLWDGFVMAFDPTDGAEIWTRQFGSDSDDKIRAIVASKDGTVYVVGETRGAITDDEPSGDWTVSSACTIAKVTRYGPGSSAWSEPTSRPR
jgi:outer membrane protein assembly factor BamB